MLTLQFLESQGNLTQITCDPSCIFGGADLMIFNLAGYPRLKPEKVPIGWTVFV